MEGARTLYNTYWIRFPQARDTFDKAVENSKTLIKAAEQAGVRRVVHISITNPSRDSPLPYFRGKALVEQAITESKLTYAIVRPTVIFSTEGILINNIAWFLKKSPLFVIPGSGDYHIQPVFVGDVAEIAVSAGRRNDNTIIDAVGPEIYTFNELVRLIAHKTGSKAKIVHAEPALSLFLARSIGCMVEDVVITKDEIKGLISNLLISEDKPSAPTRLSEWLDHNVNNVGVRYISSVKRQYPSGVKE